MILRKVQWMGAAAALVVSVAASAAGAVDAGAAGVLSAAANADAGIGTKQALANPSCDPDTKKLEMPYTHVPPCVKPWKQGADNGGATARGVTRDAVKIAVLAPRGTSSGPAAAFQGATDLETNTPAPLSDGFRDSAAVFEHLFETWGRKVDFQIMTASGTDETAQRADAVTVVAGKPFAVIDAVGEDTFCNEVAARKTVCISNTATSKTAVALAPYLYGAGIDYQAQAVNIAELIGKGLAGHPARWAGDPSMQTRKRKFGVVFASGDTGIDITQFNKGLAKLGVAKPALQLSYVASGAPAGDASAAQEAAPTMIAKLKAGGVNNVVMFTDSAMTGALTKQATAQEFRPEWTITGFAVQDLDLFARGYDQDQWAHAFGEGVLFPGASVRVPGTQYFQWYWGPNRGVRANSALSQIALLFIGIHAAGPKLTPAGFRAALFSVPPNGGAASGMVLDVQMALGKTAGLPYDEYMFGADYSLLWYDPTAQGLSNTTNTPGTGKALYLDGGKRYRAGKLPKGEPKYFDQAASIRQIDTLSGGDRLTDYPCVDCPGSSTTPTP